MADALDSGVILHADGLMMVGEYLGTTSKERADGKGRSESIRYARRRWDGDRFESDILFDPFDRDTGERTAIVDDLGGCEPGDMVAIRVKALPSKKGGVWFTALRVDRLPVADLVG